VTIELNNIGKSWGRHWLFRGINHTLTINQPTVILGANGSGKSTLLKIIAGVMQQGEGSVKWKENDTEIPQHLKYRMSGFAAPYLNLYEDLTLSEALRFQSGFKAFGDFAENNAFCDQVGLKVKKSTQIKHFSSGMKQRIKLGFALLNDAKVVFLDEPCSNLDNAGVDVYQTLVEKALNNNTLIIIASNSDEREYPAMPHFLSIESHT
jgi:ABC-2 type transport system ATP-binding protein